MLDLVSRIINSFLLDKNTLEYISLNKKIFKKKIVNSKGIILVEFHNWHPLHIAFSIAANYMSKKFSSKIVAYPGYINVSQNIKLNIQNKIKWFFGNFFKLKNFGVYKSFGVTDIMCLKYTSKIKEKGYKKASNIFKNIKTKKEILNIKIDNVLIGDLIYDTYLKKYKIETIDLKDPKFYIFFENTIILYYFWSDFFKKKNINGVIISHAVYTLAIPARIAMKYNIKVLIANHTTLYNLTKKNMLSFIEFKFFKKKFLELSNRIKKLGIEISKKRISKRFYGKIGVDMWYSTISSFGKIKSKKRVLESNKKLKILIAAHDLFDSPHVSGKLLFSDFSEWLKFLGKISKDSEYDWYLKVHPYFIKESYDKIKKIIFKYPEIKIIDPKTSHHQLIKEGIDIVLTCMGTIGFEYALFNKTVINASINNPHFDYNFNINPRNLSEYKKVLSNLSKYKRIQIMKSKIFEYYFMMHIYHPKNWIFKDINKVEKKCGDYQSMYSSKIYKCFQDEYSKKQLHKINSIFDNFFKSNKFKLDYNNIANSFYDYIKKEKLI